ncbi:MAG: sigma-70 family RNA polymerase sigma factor, partial [Fimbriiglobus sp.]|nr:sigma-70 family RNA polymerase sigma factor [Fimbriiglobus sp.]
SPTLAGFLTRIGTPDARTDGELVREYAITGNDAAFAELVRRFAPMVWGVCRRTVGHREHAEDAFQAAFVVLARKAGTIRPPRAVGAWLHAVAVHTALRARTLADRRRKRFTPLTVEPVSPMPIGPTDLDALRVLDEEIARLPAPQHAAVTLCELGGLSRKAAAERLGIAEGTLSSRLAAARKTLAARLRGRGVAFATVLAALPAAADAAPVVMSNPSDTVSSLADGAVQTMFVSKLKLTAGLVAVIAAVGVGAIWLLHAAAKDPPQLTFKAVKPQPKPKEGLIAFTTSDKDHNPLVLVVKPDGEEMARIEGFGKGQWPSNVRLSHDAKRLAFFLAHPPEDPKAGGTVDIRGELQVYDLDAPGKPSATIGKDIRNASGLWGADGKTLYVNELVEPKGGKNGEEAFTRKVTKYDVATGKGTPVELPVGHHVADVSRDGKTLLVSHVAVDEKGGVHLEPYLADADTLKLKRVTQQSVRLDRLSPDGTKAVGVKLTDSKDPSAQGLVVVDLKDGSEAAVRFIDDDTVHPPMAAWSPDGAKLLVYRRVVDGVKNEKPKVDGNVAYLPKNKQEVTIRELDGSKPRAVLEAYTFGPWFDWR